METILASAKPDFELLVVDQSTDGATREALACFAKDARLRHIATTTKGASRARNEGIRGSRAPLIAFTDDDCRVPHDWADAIADAFAEEPAMSALFGRVWVPAELLERGFVAQFDARSREYQGCYPRAGAPWGLSANMAVRRSVLDHVGAFDPLLGVGSTFHAGEEVDLTIRILAAGYRIVETDRIAVAHLGLREGEQARRLLREYAVGIGATYAKHVRLGTKDCQRLFAETLVRLGISAAGKLLNGTRPIGLAFMGWLILGAAKSIPQALDRTHNVYRHV